MTRKSMWREFRAAIAGDDEDRLAQLFADPRRALGLAERRIHLQLRALALLNAGVGLFGATTVCGLVGAALVEALLVVQDGNLLTGQNPQSSAPLAEMVIAALR